MDAGVMYSYGMYEEVTAYVPSVGGSPYLVLPYIHTYVSMGMTCRFFCKHLFSL